MEKTFKFVDAETEKPELTGQIVDYYSFSDDILILDEDNKYHIGRYYGPSDFLENQPDGSFESSYDKIDAKMWTYLPKD